MRATLLCLPPAFTEHPIARAVDRQVQSVVVGCRLIVTTRTQGTANGAENKRLTVQVGPLQQAFRLPGHLRGGKWSRPTIVVWLNRGLAGPSS